MHNLMVAASSNGSIFHDERRSDRPLSPRSIANPDFWSWEGSDENGADEVLDIWASTPLD
jgi:hypothetical protein